jgi:hypothetical protein
MFGFFKFKKSVDYATKYVLTMTGPARHQATLHQIGFPNAVFVDAHIIGFLQILVMHAANESRGLVLGVNDQRVIYQAVMNVLVKGLGKQILSVLEQINEPTHFAHVNYSVGRREGQEYVAALMSGDDKGMMKLSLAFTQFIKRNYLGLAD